MEKETTIVKDKISEEDNEQIAKTARQEFLKEKELRAKGLPPDTEIPEKKEEKKEEKKDETKPEKKSDEKPEPKSDEELLAAKDEELSDEEKEQKKTLVEIKNDELLNTKDEDLDDEKKARKAELIEAKKEAEKQAYETEIADYAKAEHITKEEARLVFESEGKIREKYKDEKGLSRAYRNMQVLYSKAQDEIKTLKEQAIPSERVDMQNVNRIIEAIDDGKFVQNGKVLTSEKVIAAYRAKFPDIATDEVSDEIVLKMAAKEIKAYVGENQKKQLSKIAGKASEKRTVLLEAIPEEDKPFVSEIKSVLEKVADGKVMDENFDLSDITSWALGQHYKQDVKDAEERGYKRGKEEAKIKEPPGGGGSKTKTTTTKTTLTKSQQERALAMFPDPNISDEEKFKMFTEIEESRKKK